MFKLKSLNLRTKLILIISGIIVPLMISSLSIISFLINRKSLEFVKQDLNKTSTAFQVIRTSKDSLLTLICEYISHNTNMARLMAQRKTSFLIKTGSKVAQLFKIDLLVIQNNQKEVLYRFPNNLRIEFDNNRPINKRLRIHYGLLANHNQIYQVAITNLEYKNKSIGRLAVGFRIGTEQASTLKKITNNEISFIFDNEIVLSTLVTGELLDELKHYYDKFIINNTRDDSVTREPIKFGKASYLVNLKPLRNIQGQFFGYLVVQSSTEKILNFNRHIKNALFTIIVSFWLCTGLVVGLFIQRHLVQPISQLAGAVDAVAKGDLSTNLELQSNDEIGVLYKGFNHMASEVRNWTGKLKEKNDELKRHSQRIEEVNQEMQDFVYVVSHDLKSPLVNIQGFTGRLAKLFIKTKSQLETLYQELTIIPQVNGYAERLQKIIENIDEKGAESFEFIHSASKKMNDMIGELLALSRVETRRMPMEPTDIGQEIDTIIKAIKYQIQEKNLRIVIDPMPTITCERTRINQVFSNLITNAVKFIGEKENKTIHIGYKEQRNHHLFFVKDNGIGIDQKDHQKIFRVFYRCDTKASGHGMGLSLAKKIITKHEGKIWLESKIGSGSVFYFTIKKYDKVKQD